MFVLLSLAVSGCARPADTGGPATLWAGGGFACVERSGFDCRLLDNHIYDYGQAALPSDPLRSVSFGSTDTCVIKTDGSASCFGSNINHSDDVPAGTWTMISQGHGQACGVHPDGSVDCWGHASNHTTPRAGPFVEVRAMDAVACARDANGTITCWGANYEGRVVAPSGSWSSFILPNTYLCMLDAAESITCSGLPDVADAGVPAGTGYHSLTGGFYHACALDPEDHAVCWGQETGGLLDAPDDEFTQIAAGDYFTCGLKADGDVECWGCRDEDSSHPERYCDWDNPAPWSRRS